ncbi:unnamed protein product [Symbiodinium sp. CCMP2456]|nr:unnamed protein product [Symbiodinium sp. CCMP2456]
MLGQDEEKEEETLHGGTNLPPWNSEAVGGHPGTISVGVIHEDEAFDVVDASMARKSSALSGSPSTSAATAASSLSRITRMPARRCLQSNSAWRRIGRSYARASRKG